MKHDLHPYPSGSFDLPFVLKLKLNDRLVKERIMPWLKQHRPMLGWATRSLYHCTLMAGGSNWYGFEFETEAEKEAFRATWQPYDLEFGDDFVDPDQRVRA